MSTDTSVTELVINKLTQSQYEGINTPSDTELYFVTDANVYQTTANLVTSVSSASTNSQYPSAKLFYDTCGDIETLINAL